MSITPPPLHKCRTLKQQEHNHQVGRICNPQSHTDQSVSLTDFGGGRSPITMKKKRETSKTNNYATIEIATYNARTLLSDDELYELEIEAENIKWDIIGLSEVRRSGEQLITLSAGHNFYDISEKNSSIGFLDHKRHQANIILIKRISTRHLYEFGNKK